VGGRELKIELKIVKFEISFYKSALRADEHKKIAIAKVSIQRVLL
jgi:hypothetical protein